MQIFNLHVILANFINLSAHPLMHWVQNFFNFDKMIQYMFFFFGIWDPEVI